MTRMTEAERSKRKRERAAGRLAPIPTCPCCGRRTMAPRDGGLCRACWLKTDAGRADTLARTQKSRARQRSAKQSSPAT